MILDEGRFKNWLATADLPQDIRDTIEDFDWVTPDQELIDLKKENESLKITVSVLREDIENAKPEEKKPMSARYEARGNSYPIKDILKIHGFRWNGDAKIWQRSDGIFDINGDSAEQAVMKVRAKLKEQGSTVDIVFVPE